MFFAFSWICAAGCCLYLTNNGRAQELFTSTLYSSGSVRCRSATSFYCGRKSTEQKRWPCSVEFWNLCLFWWSTELYATLCSVILLYEKGKKWMKGAFLGSKIRFMINYPLILLDGKHDKTLECTTKEAIISYTFDWFLLRLYSGMKYFALLICFFVKNLAWSWYVLGNTHSYQICKTSYIHRLGT